MHINTDPITPPRKPCLRDLSTLVRDHLCEKVVRLAPLKQLKRRLREIDATHPQFREETPLVLRYEEGRRQRLRGELHVAGRPALSNAHPHSAQFA